MVKQTTKPAPKAKKQKMTTIAFRLPVAAEKALELLAERDSSSKSRMLRLAVEKFIKSQTEEVNAA